MVTNQIRLTDGLLEEAGSQTGLRMGVRLRSPSTMALIHIAVMDADGHNRVMLENHASGPSWSPDGQKIAFVTVRDGRLEIYVIGADGQGLERVTHDFLGGFSPSFSPDGQRIAYYASHAGFSHIYVMGADGKSPMRGLRTIKSIIRTRRGLPMERRSHMWSLKMIFPSAQRFT